MLRRALLLEMQWATVQSSHKKLMETPPSSSRSRPQRNASNINPALGHLDFSACRSLPSEPRPAQPVLLDVGDVGQDQSKAGATLLSSQPAWNPFDDDDFANLPAEEFTAEDRKPAGQDRWCSSLSDGVQLS